MRTSRAGGEMAACDIGLRGETGYSTGPMPLIESV